MADRMARRALAPSSLRRAVGFVTISSGPDR